MRHRGIRGVAGGLRLALAVMAVGLASPAAAVNPYSPALTVNNGVVTHYDIDQRAALLSALGATGDLRALAIEQLTEDRVKIQAADALGIELAEGALEAGLEEFATARGLTKEAVLEAIGARGIDRQAMDDFVASGLLWREVVVARFRDRARPDEADLDTALELAANRPREILTLSEIALPFAENGEAETQALAERLVRDLSAGADFGAAARRYSRSASAEAGGLLAPVPATQLPPAIRTQVLLLEPGEVAGPVPIGGGLAILKLMSIREETPAAAADGAEPDRQALREQLFSERITNFGQGYLQELLGDALIVER